MIEKELLKEEQLELLQSLLMEVAMDRMKIIYGVVDEDGGYVMAVVNE